MKSRILASLLLIAAALPAGSQSIVATGPSFVESRLLVGARAPDGAREAGIALEIADGWKTYWRNPGEAGVPPAFDWSGSTNLAAVEIGWPVPQVFDSFGFRTIGYSGAVVLPLRLVPEDAARPIGLDLDMELGVCRDICVFEQAELAARIAPADPGAGAAEVAAAQARVMPGGAEAGVVAATCRVSGAGEDRAFAATVEFDRPVATPHVALEGPEESWFHATRTEADGNRLEIASTLSLPGPDTWIDRSALRITVLGDGLAADIRGCTAG